MRTRAKIGWVKCSFAGFLVIEIITLMSQSCDISSGFNTDYLTNNTEYTVYTVM